MHDDVQAEHAATLATIDPLLNVQPLPAEGQLLSARNGDARAIGVASFTEHDPSGKQALWSGLRQHTLDIRLAGTGRADALDTLLTDWLGGISADPGDWESVAQVTVPARDAVYGTALVRHGFAPLVATAARRGGAAPVAHARPVTGIRLARADDLPTLAAFSDELHDVDTAYGAIMHRDGQREILATGLAAHLAAHPDWLWVAEQEGELVGFAEVQPPAAAGWMAHASAAGEQAAYFSSMYLSPTVRGGGLGAALAGAAHDALDASGVPITTLHHLLPNPHSTPFWARMGYRPLWITWQRRPVHRADGAASGAR